MKKACRRHCILVEHCLESICVKRVSHQGNISMKPIMTQDDADPRANLNGITMAVGFHSFFTNDSSGGHNICV